MRRIWLDYVAPPPGWYWPGWALLTLSVIAVASLAFLHARFSAQAETLKQQVHRLERLAVQAQAPANSGAADADAALKQRIAAYGAERWEALFDDLEDAADDTVTLVSLVPDKGVVTLEGEAKTLADAIAYMERLKAADSLRQPELSEFSAAKNHPRKPVRFTLTARWPGGAE